MQSFQTYNSPKAANIQMVFYKPKRGKKGDVLVKVLLNGSEASIDALPTYSGPYYKWDALKAFLTARTDSFVTR